MFKGLFYRKIVLLHFYKSENSYVNKTTRPESKKQLQGKKKGEI
jgi:hypothetical protein